MALTEHASDPAGDTITDAAGAASAQTSDPAGPRAGELSSAWRVIVVVACIGAVLAWSAVWSVAVQLGQSPWWLGTRASPTSPVIRLAPFVGPVAAVVGAIVSMRRLAWLGTAAGLVFVGYGVADLGGHADLGVVELGIGVAVLVVALASLTGTYRAADAG